MFSVYFMLNMFGHTLRILRSTAGISLREMAREMNVSPAYLSQVERGLLPPPTHERIHVIAGILGIPESSLREMIARPDPEILSLLAENPELNQFIYAASSAGLNYEDYRNMLNLIRELGPDGFRKLLHYGTGHAADFLPAKKSVSPKLKSIHQEFREILDSSMQKELVFPRLNPGSKEELFRVFLNKAHDVHDYLDTDSLFHKLIQREKETSSGLGNGAAVPHLLDKSIENTILVMGRIPQGMAFGAVDKKPVYLIILILDHEDNSEFHLNLLAYLAGKIQHPLFINNIKKAKTKNKIYDLLTGWNGHGKERRIK